MSINDDQSSRQNHALKRSLSSRVLFTITIVGYIVNFAIGGFIGSAFAVLGIIALLMGIVGLVRELRRHDHRTWQGTLLLILAIVVIGLTGYLTT
jgi:uncharacterized membrane protein HdeD (DUF308 family)